MGHSANFKIADVYEHVDGPGCGNIGVDLHENRV